MLPRIEIPAPLEEVCRLLQEHKQEGVRIDHNNRCEYLRTRLEQVPGVKQAIHQWRPHRDSFWVTLEEGGRYRVSASGTLLSYSL